MFGLEFYQLAIISGAIFVGGIVKGITGIGLPIVTIAILLNFLPPATTLAIVVVPILVTNLWQAVRAGSMFTLVRRFWTMILFFIIFLLVSARLVVELDTDVLFAVLGACIVLFSASSLVRPRLHPLSPETARWAGPLAGALGGMLGGISTIWGPPMMMYFLMLKLDRETWIRAVGLVWFIGSVPLALSYWGNGILNSATAPLSVAACVPGMAGIFVGEFARRRIDPETFRKVLLVTLFLIGLNLIRRSLF